MESCQKVEERSGRGKETHMRGRRARISWPLIMIGTLTGLLIHPTPAHAQAPCSLLHACSDGSGGLDDVVDQLDDPVDEAIDAVGDATGVDTTPVKDVKKKVDDTVDRILEEAPGTGGGTQPGDGGEAEPGGNETPGSHTPSGTRPGRSTGLRPTARIQAAPEASGKVGAEPEPGVASASTTPTSVMPERPSRRTPLAAGPARAVPEVIRQLAFPLILALAVFMFLVVQSRMDNTDNKLVQAPQDTHYLSFQ
jgi:hypothetical protein